MANGIRREEQPSQTKAVRLERTELTSINGARTWCGQVLRPQLVKISAPCRIEPTTSPPTPPHRSCEPSAPPNHFSVLVVCPAPGIVLYKATFEDLIGGLGPW